MLFKTSQFIGKYSQSPVLCLQLPLDCQSFREEAEISVFPPPWEPSMKPIWRLSPATVPMGSGLTDHPKKSSPSGYTYLSLYPAKYNTENDYVTKAIGRKLATWVLAGGSGGSSNQSTEMSRFWLMSSLRPGPVSLFSQIFHLLTQYPAPESI